MKKIFKLGFPSFLLSLGEQVVTFTMVVMIGWLGSTQLAVDKASGQYLNFFKAPSDAIRQASQIYISRSVGKANRIDMRRYGNMGILMELGLNLIPLTLFAAIPTQLTKAFLSSSDIEGLDSFIRTVFITRAISNLLEMIQVITGDNLRGLFDTWYPSIINLITTIAVIMPLTYLLGFVANWDLIGMNVAGDIGMGLSMSLLLHRWNTISQEIEHDNIQQAESTVNSKFGFFYCCRSKKHSLDNVTQNSNENDLIDSTDHYISVNKYTTT